jgi:hypothetical protein
MISYGVGDPLIGPERVEIPALGSLDKAVSMIESCRHAIKDV